jgi:mRNA interferase MazF
MSTYVPDRGHFIYIECSPQAGREQAGRRPALVLSPTLFNRMTGFVMACPITNTVRNRPFEVPVPHGSVVKGVVLCDQLKSFDWRARNVDQWGVAPTHLVNEVLARIHAVLDLNPD